MRRSTNWVDVAVVVVFEPSSAVVGIFALTRSVASICLPLEAVAGSSGCSDSEERIPDLWEPFAVELGMIGIGPSTGDTRDCPGKTVGFVCGVEKFGSVLQSNRVRKLVDDDRLKVASKAVWKRSFSFRDFSRCNRFRTDESGLNLLPRIFRKKDPFGAFDCFMVGGDS